MKKNFSTIERSRIDQQPIHGVIVKESDRLVLMHRMMDFFFDGMLVVRQKDITNRTTGSSCQQRYENIMRAEGLWKSTSRFITNLPVSDWKDLLRSLARKPVLIENEKKSSSWFGVVESCSEKETSLRCFDSLGVFDDNLTRIPYRIITAIQFGDRYTQLQFKYAEKARSKSKNG